MGFAAGIACVFRGLGRLATTPALWAYAWAPVAAGLAVTLAILFLLKRFAAEPVADWAHEMLGGTEWADWVATALVWAVALLVLFFTFSAMVRVLAAPLLALLADRTVAGLIGRPSPAAPGGPLVRWIVRPFAEAMIVLAIRCAILVAALPVLLVPVVGTAIFALVGMALLGVDLLDIAQSARGVLLGERLGFIVRNFGACLGLGVAAGLLMLVPGLNVLLLPGIVVAGVLLDSRIAPDFPKAAAA